MIQLAIFDLDGTLLNSIADLAASVNYALLRHGYPEHDLSLYPGFVGNGALQLIERALPETARTTEQILRLCEDFIDYYSRHNTELTCPYPGIPELLDGLHLRGIGLAVASNKYHEGTVKLVDHFFGRIPFKAVLGQREHIPIKPDPTIVYEILDRTGVEKSNTLYIGDSGVDMQTAVNSGTIAVGVTWGLRSRSELEDNGARFIIDRPEEIKEIIRGIGNRGQGAKKSTFNYSLEFIFNYFTHEKDSACFRYTS